MIDFRFADIERKKNQIRKINDRLFELMELRSTYEKEIKNIKRDIYGDEKRKCRDKDDKRGPGVPKDSDNNTKQEGD